MNKKMRAIVAVGENGRKALNEYGEAYFDFILIIDNIIAAKCVSSKLPAISTNEYLMLGGIYVLLAVDEFADEYYWMLKEKDFICKIYQPIIESYYDKSILVHNPYEDKRVYRSEQEWNDNLITDNTRKHVHALADSFNNNPELFDHVEIETYNRCNGGCSFCPVNRLSDSREEEYMSEKLFSHIIDQLSELNYQSSLALFSNNEPFLDKRICDFQRYAREKLPNARLYLFTNGTVLTLEKFLSIIDYLDELIIDNYSQSMQLIPTVKVIRDYCESHKELYSKVTIVLRHPREILTSRGGYAPNREIISNIENDKCVLPFRQLIIRPDGKVSACCNDALGIITLGDLQNESIVDVWNGKAFCDLRTKLLEGRGNVDLCSKCDSFLSGLRMTRKE